ncbi:MAG: prolipoprotein diacylglyceryl transferase, partial [Candidatus Eisenbacteria bacterium]|nr:prolipoprotein diacylglyceryl transferase [Candidatus Eisenbacteria bacterium]
GKQFGLYLILTGLERFVVEFWRTNQRDVMGLTVAQVFGIGAILLGGLLFARRGAAGGGMKDTDHTSTQ